MDKRQSAVMTRQSYKTRRREMVKHDPTITSRPLHGSLAHDGGDALARAGVGSRRQGEGNSEIGQSV